MESFFIKNLSDGEVVCFVEGENIKEVCKTLFFDSKFQYRKIGDYYYIIIPAKKIKTELELFHLVA